MGCVASQPDVYVKAESFVQLQAIPGGKTSNMDKPREEKIIKVMDKTCYSPARDGSPAYIRAETGPTPTSPSPPVPSPPKSSQLSFSQAPAPSKLRKGKKLSEIYKLDKTVGTGGFSVVKLATDRVTGKQYACKIMSLPLVLDNDLNDDEENSRNSAGGPPEGVQVPESSREDIFKEINIQGDLQHENIIHLKEYFEEGNKVFLITELLNGGELLNAVLSRGSYSEAEARLCIAQLLKGIQYLHSRGVVHRDLKLENLLLEYPGDIRHIKIADFGLAKKTVGQAAMQTICGTPQYVAPEVIQGRLVTQYGPGVDMWSAGIVLFILLGGYPPFYSESEPALFELIRQGKFGFHDPVWKSVSSTAKDLIRKLLAVDPAKRLSATEALKHPWLDLRQSDVHVALPRTQDNLKQYLSMKR